jgi:hypothetical protein
MIIAVLDVLLALVALACALRRPTRKPVLSLLLVAVAFYLLVSAVGSNSPARKDQPSKEFVVARSKMSESL